LLAGLAGAAAAAAGLLPGRAEARPVNATPAGVAIEGFDPVAYFKEGKPVKGSEAFTAEHDGVTWHFASAANRDAFKEAPEKYAPQFGGYCAYAVSRGYTAKIDPQAWSIVAGKLYLNYSLGVRERWAQDKAGNIAKGEANWPRLKKAL
ncbi:MAG: YHS domain-containing protein, partial [Alphaproteobacteria bacterium]